MEKLQVSINRDRLRKFRVEKTMEVLKKRDLDAIIATTFDNVRYIGDVRPYFTAVYYVNTYAAFLMRDGTSLVQGPVVEGAPMGLSPPVKGWDGYPMIPIPAIASQWASMVATTLKDRSVTSGRVGIDDVSFKLYLELKRLAPSVEVVSVYNDMLQARAIKNEDEIALLRKAAQIVDVGAEAGLSAIKPGVREREVVAAAAAAMYEAGSEGEPWATSFSSGERSLTSLFASDRILKEGDLGSFDLGSIYEGYLGDIARTGGVGTVGRESREIYTAAYDALQAGIAAVRPGTLSSTVDGRIRETLRQAGCEVPPLSTGHGIGVGAPEIPWITPRSEAAEDFELRAGMVVALEPRTTRNKITSAGCEDTMLVTDGGHELLTNCRREEHLLVR